MGTQAGSRASLAHLPCTSGRCPEAAHLWGRRRHRRAPAGTAGTDGSSRRCPPHTACGLWETGPGDTVPELTLDPHSRLARLGHPACPPPPPPNFLQQETPSTSGPLHGHLPCGGHPQPSLAGSQDLPAWESCRPGLGVPGVEACLICHVLGSHGLCTGARWPHRAEPLDADDKTFRSPWHNATELTLPASHSAQDRIGGTHKTRNAESVSRSVVSDFLQARTVEWIAILSSRGIFPTQALNPAYI